MLDGPWIRADHHPRHYKEKPNIDKSDRPSASGSGRGADRIRYGCAPGCLVRQKKSYDCAVSWSCSELSGRNTRG